MNEQSGNSEQLPPDAVSGGDARAQFEAWAEARGLDLNKRNHTKVCLLTAYAWAAWQAALAARQPVGVVVGHVCRDSSEARMCANLPEGAPLYAAPPAPAAVPMDAPYSLDADPAGIRSRVADCIAGTMMVGAQDHTPPPADHWLEPFWNMARADAAVPVDGATAMVIRDALARAIGCGYVQGHRDTKEGKYVEVRYEDRTKFHGELADDLLTGDRDFASIAALATHPQLAAAKYEMFVCTGDEIRCHDGNGCECAMRGLMNKKKDGE